MELRHTLNQHEDLEINLSVAYMNHLSPQEASVHAAVITKRLEQMLHYHFFF